MAINKKIWIAGIFVAWLSALAFSIFSYFHMAHDGCYFLSSWPFCVASKSALLVVLQLVIISLLFLAFVMFGKYLFDRVAGADLSGKKKIICISAVVTILSAIIVLPFASGDSVFYFNVARAASSGANIYLSDWTLINNYLFPVKNSIVSGVMYGPLTIYLFKIVYFISGGNQWTFIFIWKALMALFFVFTSIVLWKMISVFKLQINKWNFYLFILLQPIFLFEWVVNGHFDVIWILFTLLAFLAGFYKRWWLAAAFLAIAIWAKFIPIFFVPFLFLWWYQDITKENLLKNIYQAFIGIILAIIITILSWWPFWAGVVVLKPLVLQSKWAVFSIFSLIYYSLFPLIENHFYTTVLAHIIILVVALYLIWPVIKKMIMVLFRRIKLEPIQFLNLSFVGLLIYLFVWQKSFWPWYCTWLISLAVIPLLASGNNRLKKIILWIALAPFFFYIPPLLMSGDAPYLWNFYFVVCLAIIYPLINLFIWRKSGYELN